jgi:hypothetical protein
MPQSLTGLVPTGPCTAGVAPKGGRRGPEGPRCFGALALRYDIVRAAAYQRILAIPGDELLRLGARRA